jgi:hypothetical protein
MRYLPCNGLRRFVIYSEQYYLHQMYLRERSQATDWRLAGLMLGNSEDDYCALRTLIRNSPFDICSLSSTYRQWAAVGKLHQTVGKLLH